ncbi:hypothetical protein CEP53_013963 [Fusarium sp. AF-6]|nr:hypothetical protein CEP53_013963 [Fusarium sp. AF-6]
MVDTARRLLDSLSEEEKQLAVFPADSDDCRKWSNPELILYECGIRLEHLEENKIYLILELLRSSLSEKGFAKVRGAMKTNKFLGHICERQAILNEYSYCGPDEGVEICAEEGRLGLQLMQSLAPKHQQKAQTYVKMHDPVMPKGRYNPADQRHLAGAFQDNRVIPYEGVLAQNLTKEQQDLLMAIVAEFLILLPSKPLAIRLQQIRSWICETYFSWIGGYGPDDPFYYRIQSPVVLLEFDHHSGVFLTNEEPAKYHIHTIQRLPNGNDYGKEVKRMALLAAESRS